MQNIFTSNLLTVCTCAVPRCRTCGRPAGAGSSIGCVGAERAFGQAKISAYAAAKAAVVALSFFGARGSQNGITVNS